MNELELVGLSDDSEHLVLRGASGQEFKLRVDEELRAAVRRDRVGMERLRDAALTPREIQVRIRAGATAAELADEAGLPLEYVSRYASAVEDERAFVARQAQAATIGHAADAPTLGDLVVDRMAGRGVDPDAIGWDAYRPSAGPWTVVATFEAGGTGKQATWSFDPATATLTATDDEARWLTETEIVDSPIPLRHLNAVDVYDVEADDERTDQLLDDLRSRRGIRPVTDSDEDDEADDEEFEGFGPRRVFEREATVRPADDAEVLPIPVPDPPRKPAPVKRTRPSVPSWDEIVFGGRPE